MVGAAGPDVLVIDADQIRGLDACGAGLNALQVPG